MNKQIIGLILAVCIAVIGVLYWAFSEEIHVPDQDKKVEEPPVTMSYQGNTLSEEKDGKKIWDLTAETIEIETNTKNAILKNIQGIFYQENGQTVTLTAPQALYDHKTKDITMQGEVMAKSSDGATFQAKTVIWQSQNQIFQGEGNVIVTRDDTVLTGDKIESDAGVVKVKVAGNAHIIKGGVTQ
ncbi:LPS export ABC transporter periplasmic protein LptC [Anaerosinus massiliensis]|uniref:LPS export ABC transporter periplasmic protein LptC n=1 Tax=Massilibacillus massiliensis TaxID=1806837 RepID=UPI000DA63302|nr:LPS export ABC transporter periplasmic protein LptC [Massilibacillus massiliensis]